MKEELRKLISCSTKADQNQSLRTLLSMQYDGIAVRDVLEECKDEKERQAIRKYTQHTTVKAFHEGKYTVGNEEQKLITLTKMELHGGGTQTFSYDSEVAIGGCRRFSETKIKCQLLKHALDLLDPGQSELLSLSDQRPPGFLNIANPTQPGGDYSRGKEGPEEEYCRRTNIFAGLHDPQKKYSGYKKWSYPLSQYQVVVSSSVTAIRNGSKDGYNFRTPCGQLVIFSTPFPRVDKKGMQPLMSFNRSMRILLTVSAKYSVQTLVMPFFHTEIEDATRALYNLITNESKYKGLVQRIILVPENNTMSVRLEEFLTKNCNTGEKVKQKRSIELPTRDSESSGGGLKRPKNDTTQRLNMASRYAEALKTDDGSDISMADEIGSEIEIAMFNYFKGNLSGKSFMGQFREILIALKCKDNKTLRSRILSRSLMATTLPMMSSKSFLNPTQQLKHQSIIEEVTADLTAGTTTEVETSIFLCSRCKKRRCTYYELQTRSGDEPMTQFVSCLNCGKKWTC